MRLILVTVHVITSFNIARVPRKKTFNPVLGETFEYITQNYRYFGEQVSHHPPISAFSVEGEGYSIIGHSLIKPKFSFDMGRGRLDLQDSGHLLYELN